MPTATRLAVKRSKPPSKPRLSKELRDFCDRMEISPHLPALMEMVQRHFPMATNQRLELGCDPESGEQWLAIHITMNGKPADAERRYRAFTKEKVQRIPYPAIASIRLADWNAKL